LGVDGSGPKWSPDGSKIVFAKHPDIWVMDADGSNATDVTSSNCGSGTSCSEASWSPDGTKILFQRWVPVDWEVTNAGVNSFSEIFSMNTDGSGLARLTEKASACDPQSFFIGVSVSGNNIHQQHRCWGNEYPHWGPAALTPAPTATPTPTPTPTVTPTPAPTAVPVYDKIVFAEKDDVYGRYDIFIMDSDGSNKINLTNTPDVHSESNPKFSPSGNKIVFNGQNGEGGGIWVMDPDGSNKIQLTNSDGPWSGGYDSDPSWSPDGTKIVYNGNRRAFTNALQRGIWTINVDGSDAKRIWQSPDEISRRIGNPVFSPDGTKIFFKAEGTNYVINSDGTNVTQVAYQLGHVGRYDWSPDGTKIAFMSDRSIWVMNADGANPTNLNVTPPGTQSGGLASPRWSPDGSKIIFYVENYGSNWQDYNGLYVMNADGSNVTKVTGGSFSSNCSPQPCGGFSIANSLDWGPAAP
jgi:Tol biopolymer transport system component